MHYTYILFDAIHTQFYTRAVLGHRVFNDNDHRTIDPGQIRMSGVRTEIQATSRLVKNRLHMHVRDRLGNIIDYYYYLWSVVRPSAFRAIQTIILKVISAHIIHHNWRKTYRGHLPAR